MLFEHLTRFQCMSGQKLRRVHSPAAFALQFENSQRVFATTDNDAGFVRRQNFASDTGFFGDFRLPDFQKNWSQRAWISAFRRFFRPNGIAA